MADSSENIVDSDRIEHLYLALRSIRKVDQLLIKNKDRSRLLQEICNTLIRNRSYYNSWIVILDESNNVVETAEAGLGEGFLPMMDMLNQGTLTACARRALAGPDVVIVGNPYQECSDCPLSAKYSGRAAMTVRLENNEKIYGLLCVSIPKRYTRDSEEHELLKEIAGDIAFGLEKLRAEESFLESESSFRDLVENSPIGILIVQDGVVVYCNQEQGLISGIHHKLDRPFEFVNVHPDDIETVKRNFAKVTSGVVQKIDMDFRFFPLGKMDSRSDMKWVYCRASSIEYRGKTAILITMIDISRPKELEHLLTVKDKMISLGRIAAGIAHEIRNPLSGINIYLNTLEDIYNQPDNLEMAGKIIQQIQSASRKIESIIKRVIDFSKPGEPKFILADINEPVREAVKLSSVAMRKSGIKIEKSLQKNLPTCRVDPDLIEEVILNLMTNAAEAMKNLDTERRIRISSGISGDAVLITVSDSGPGVPADIRTKIFEPFYTTKNDSTGIGLSLCHRIITDHGGTLEIETSRWSGAEFVIKIPVETVSDIEP